MPLIERVSIIFNEHTDYRTTSDQRRSQQRSDGGVRRWLIKFEVLPAYQSATPIPNATADLAARKAPSLGRRDPGRSSSWHLSWFGIVVIVAAGPPDPDAGDRDQPVTSN